MRIHNLPIRSHVAIAGAINGLVACGTQCAEWGAAVVGCCVVDCHINHLMIRRPEHGFVYGWTSGK